MHVRSMCLSHTIHHQHISVTFVIIVRLIYRNIRNPNSLTKCITEPLEVTKNALTFLYSNWISPYLPLESDKFQFFKNT
jgi:hypothetical protein